MDAITALISVAAIVFGVVSLVALVLKLRRRPATTGVTDATVEVASTEAHRATLARGVKFAARLFIGMAAGLPVVLLGASLYVSASNPRLTILDSLAIFGGISGTIALVIGGIGWWQVRALRADLQQGTFLRTTGPVKVTTVRHGSFLDLVDRSFGVTYDVGHTATSTDVDEVDHSPRGHYVFEMRDRAGTVVYRDKHYRPES